MKLRTVDAFQMSHDWCSLGLQLKHERLKNGVKASVSQLNNFSIKE